MATMVRRVQRVDYVRARQLMLVVGLVIIGLIVMFNYYRRVDTTEVVGVMLFAPVFVALVLWGLKGGAAAGVAAAGVYLGMRYPAIRAVDEPWFVWTLVGRSAAFVVFGVVGGWGTRQMANSLTKLELYDQIDDVTGLYNARFFGQELDVEMAKMARYQGIFSVAVVEIPRATLAHLTGRKRGAAMKVIGTLIKRSIRPMDRVVHAASKEGQIIAAILPETPVTGAWVFVDRLADGLAQQLSLDRTALTRQTLAFPDDELALKQLRTTMAGIDRMEHPPSPSARAAATGA
jgi:GGDEF domain-containing protein